MREKGITGLAQLVPVDEIVESSLHEIKLRCTHQEFILMERFVDDEYMPGDDPLLGFEEEQDSIFGDRPN